VRATLLEAVGQEVTAKKDQCVQTVTLMEKRASALDWLVKRLLSSIKKKQVPLKEKRDY
jgi:hypothetical protein